MDPPRPETAKAVQDAKRAGIVPVMITGDHKVTAMAVAEKVGIREPDDMALTGDQLNRMREEELEQDLERIYTLRDLNYDPYVMVYNRESTEKRDPVRILQRWVNNKIIFKGRKQRRYLMLISELHKNL